MAKIKTVGTISEFMAGKTNPVTPQKNHGIMKKVVVGTLLPFVIATPKALAAGTAPVAVTASATGYIADKSLQVIAHALDPMIQLMVAVSFPIASTLMVASCFYFMFGNNEKAWDGITKAGLGYILIQLSPLFLKILKEIGSAVV